jgi:hypothetical protein
MKSRFGVVGIQQRLLIEGQEEDQELVNLRIFDLEHKLTEIKL